MLALLETEKALKDSEAIKWALSHRGCKITEAPHWIIMVLLEDIVHAECHLIEQLVTALDDFQGWVTEEGYLERAVEKLMNNVLLASLYEDGSIEDSHGLLDGMDLFDFHNGLDIHLDLSPFERADEFSAELDMFQAAAGCML